MYGARKTPFLLTVAAMRRSRWSLNGSTDTEFRPTQLWEEFCIIQAGSSKRSGFGLVYGFCAEPLCLCSQTISIEDADAALAF
jgi:hypothetical protein